jgi:hypothetical protein
MVADTDKDPALSWAGDESPAPAVSAPPPGKVELVEPVSAAKPAIPAALLITYGILGGIYLIYTIGWVIAVQRLNASLGLSAEPLNAIMFQLGEGLAIASPAIWFGAALLLTRRRKPLVRLVLLLLGLVAVLPWAFVLGAWL